MNLFDMNGKEIKPNMWVRLPPARVSVMSASNVHVRFSEGGGYCFRRGEASSWEVVDAPLPTKVGSEIWNVTAKGRFGAVRAMILFSDGLWRSPSCGATAWEPQDIMSFDLER